MLVSYKKIFRRFWDQIVFYKANLYFNSFIDILKVRFVHCQIIESRNVLD